MAAFTSILAAAGGFLQLGQAYSQAQDEKLAGEFQRSQYRFNEKLAEARAEDAMAMGEKAASQVRRQGKQVASAQRAAQAAQGINIDSGSAALVREDTRQAVEEDLVTIHNNAWREAWGYKAQALSLAFQGEQAYQGAQNSANNTLLTGGIQAIGSGLQAYQGSNYYQGQVAASAKNYSQANRSPAGNGGGSTVYIHQYPSVQMPQIYTPRVNRRPY